MSSGRHKPYPKYHDSGTKWLGNIPIHWTAKRLGQFFDERREKVSDKHYAPLSVTMQGIVPQLETAAKTDDGDNRKLVRASDFVINSRSDRKGSAGVSPLDGSVSLISTVLTPRNIEPRYVHHLLRSYPFQEEYYRFGKGIVADLWSTNYSEMKNILIPELPLPEQTQIAKFLDHETAKIDRLIEKQEELIRLLKEKRQAVISHAVTKGLNPHAPLKDSGIAWLGQVPAHWKLKPLKYLMSLTSGGTPSKENPEFWEGTVPWASSKDLKSDELFDTQDHITQKALDRGAAELIPPGRILTVVRGMILLHTFPISVTRVPMAINQDLKALQPQPGISTDFLAWLLRGASDVVLSTTDEAGHGTKVLRMESWLAIQVPIPPPEEQARIVAGIVDRLGKLDDLTEDAQRAVTLLQERRTALISAAVTGKIDVRHWQPRGNL